MHSVGTAYSVADGLTVIEREQPDVAVVDYRLRDGLGSDLVRGICTRARRRSAW